VHGDLAHRRPLAKSQATLRPAQTLIVAAGALHGFDQQKPQQAIALLRRKAEALPPE
jgi:hypothetical protein